jgi:chemotaxis signal transduction protein
VVSEATPTRLILFEVAQAVYALPIADVLEVLENSDPVGIPTLPPETGGVVNHHGEALPVIAPAALFEGSDDKNAAEHLLVLGGIGSEAGQLGIPVERVLGLADAVLDPAPSASWIRERVTLDERVVAVLDAGLCLDRAEEAFSSSVVNARGAQRGAPAGLEELVHELSTVSTASTGEGSP